MLITLMYILIGLLGIGFAIFIHELGHFIAARFFHVDVEVLSYGFGPRLLSIFSRGTEYRLSAIPLGGYCRMKGSEDIRKALANDEKNISSAEPGSIYSIHPSGRFMIYAAGPAASFIAAALFLAVLSLIPVARLSDPACIAPISQYPELFGEAEKQPGIEHGDILISAGGEDFEDWQDAERYLRSHQGQEINAEIIRNGIRMETVLEPLEINGNTSFGITNLQAPVIGRSMSDDFLPGDVIIEADGKEIDSTLDLYAIGKQDFVMLIERDGEILERIIQDGQLPFALHSDIRVYSDSEHPLAYGIRRSSEMFAAALSAIGALLSFNADDALTSLTGPVQAAESIGNMTVLAFQDNAGSGIRAFLLLLAAVSASIAAGNILPIPALDGGQMLISLAEAIRGKSLSPRAYIILGITGIILAIGLMILIYSLDIKAYFFQ